MAAGWLGRVVCALGMSVVVGLAGCQSVPMHRSDRAAAGEPKAQLFVGLGDHSRPTSTGVPEAQAYFDQGLTWAYGFNHDEAVRSFTRAAELDPSFAAAWWGVALAHGPHVNNPVMSEERSRLAWEALAMARERAGAATEVERALIDALGARYAWPAPADRRALDQAYADAMRGVHERFPEDLDVATLYAEALMDLQPWAYWGDQGEPVGGTTVVVSVLESVLAANPRHPGAAHLYIHAMEASRDPGKAKAAADMLRRFAPASGHLTHMPAHIDVRIGQWAMAAQANRWAIESDESYRKLSPRQDFYRVYMMHNQSFLSWACMMLGRSEESIAAGRAAVEMMPDWWVRRNAGAIDGYMTVHMDALKRFGRWDEILALPAPPPHLPYSRAMWRYTRGVALAAQGRPAMARLERAEFVSAVTLVPQGAVAQINPAHRVLELALRVLDGEIAYVERDYDRAERELRAAIAIEDTLLYMEPPDWMQPARHTLGVVLMDAGRFADAESTYREDLARWPENGWSLLGLEGALRAQGRDPEADEVRRRLDLAWAGADIRPRASCLCAPSAK